MSILGFRASWRTLDHAVSGPEAVTLINTRRIITVRRVEAKSGERIEITDTIGRVFTVEGESLERWAKWLREDGETESDIQIVFDAILAKMREAQHVEIDNGLDVSVSMSPW
jgi:pyruvate-formate lyase-activating enzyme